MCLAYGHNAVTPVRLEPAIPRSRVKNFTTWPLRSRKDCLLIAPYHKAKNPSISEALQGGVCSRVAMEYIDLFLCPQKHCMVLKSVLTLRGIHERRQICSCLYATPYASTCYGSQVRTFQAHFNHTSTPSTMIRD